MKAILLALVLTLICSLARSDEASIEQTNPPQVSSNDTHKPSIVETTTTPSLPTSSSSKSPIPYEALDIIDKSPTINLHSRVNKSELVEMRGFLTETHYTRTKDGYYIHLTRIINPLNSGENEIFKRPVIFNHGLVESSTIWLINSHNVCPFTPPKYCALNRTFETNNSTVDGIDTLHLNAPMMLSSYGYDVWLMDMRGTDWSLNHDLMGPKEPKFWDYSLDEFALIDVPTVIDFVRRKTGSPKIGYIGHSQATFAIFGLLSIRPRYAEILEPIVAIAPVSYFDHVSSIARLLFLGTLEMTDTDKHGPFPWNGRAIRRALSKFCKSNKKDFSCQLLAELVSGVGKKALKGYFNHLPFYTSLKVLRHFGQLIKYKTNTMYDYGSKENLRLYGQIQAPSYPIEKIRSKSLCLVSTKSDALAPPEDVDRFKKRLKVPLFRDIFIDRDFNHLDLILDIEAIELVMKPILEIFESFELKSGGCLAEEEIDNSNEKLTESNEIVDS